jgi:hypothetical protein
MHICPHATTKVYYDTTHELMLNLMPTANIQMQTAEAEQLSSSNTTYCR